MAAASSRRRWSSQFSFVLASAGSAIGFGNIWRFPKLAYSYGGGAFLVPYLLALLLFAIPLVVLEFALGQRHQASHVEVMRRLHPRAAGLGWAAVLGTFLVSQFYVALLAITLSYLLASFSSPLPWADAPPSALGANASAGGSRAHAYFADVVTRSVPLGVDGARGAELVPGLSAAYFALWVLVAAGAARSSQSIEALNRVLLPVPLAVLLVFLVRGLTLPGATDGLAAFATPDFSQLWSAEIWIAAISQLFFGTSAGLGTLTTYASFSEPGSPVVLSAVCVCVGNSAFSLLAGATVFSFLGHLAHERGVPIASVVTGGPSLAFEVFPSAFSTLPYPQLWAVGFFLMLLNLGVSSAVSMTAPLSTALVELLDRPSTDRPAAGTSTGARAGAGADGGGALAAIRRLSSRTGGAAPTLALHALGFLTGLVYVTRSGVFWVDLADHFVPMYLTVRGEAAPAPSSPHPSSPRPPLPSQVTVGLCECALVSRARGGHALVASLPDADRKGGAWWVLCWRWIIPPALVLLLLAQSSNELRSPYGANTGGGAFPPWALAFGWLLALGPTSLVCCGLSSSGGCGLRRLSLGPRGLRRRGVLPEVTPAGARSTLAVDAEVELEVRAGTGL